MYGKSVHITHREPGMIRCGNNNKGTNLHRHATADDVKACYFQPEPDYAAEIWAEDAWLRAAESTEYPCHCGRGQGGICC
jgi:hypothetical protein